MSGINRPQAKTNLSLLVEALERGEEREIIIARNGRLVAKRAPVGTIPTDRRIGVARGPFEMPDDIDGSTLDVAHLFLGDAVG